MYGQAASFDAIDTVNVLISYYVDGTSVASVYDQKFNSNHPSDLETTEMRHPHFLNTILGVRSVDEGQKDVMKSLNASRWQTFRRLEYPSTLPYILAGMEVAIIFAVIGAIVGEYLGGDQGLGYQIVTSLNNLEAERLFAVIFCLTLFGFILYLAVVALKRFLIPWHASAIDNTTAST